MTFESLECLAFRGFCGDRASRMPTHGGKPELASRLAAVLLFAVTAAAASPNRLARWSFEQPAWQSDAGAAVALGENVSAASSFDGMAASFVSNALPSRLVYRAVEPTGRTNWSPGQGCIRFQFRPAWQGRSAFPGPTPSTAPARPLRLLEVGALKGDRAVPALALSILPGGTNIQLTAWDSGGREHPLLLAALAWPFLREQVNLPFLPLWQEIILNYTPSNTTLHVGDKTCQDQRNKAWSGGGIGIAAMPPAHELRIALGSSLDGQSPSGGCIDAVETFDQPITVLHSHTLLEQSDLRAEVTPLPPSVRLRWIQQGNEKVTVRRADLATTNWVNLPAPVGTLSLLDTNVVLGAAYEYRIGNRAITVGLHWSPPENRGRVILLVDQTLAPKLESALRQFQEDLTGDGWTWVRHDVPRHNDIDWHRPAGRPQYKANLEQVKRLITAEYAAHPAEMKAVCLIGHVTVPCSGAASEDGHVQLMGAWPADTFYGEMNGAWTDHRTQTRPLITNPIVQNAPGDGKFDADIFDEVSTNTASPYGEALELAVGRIDFAHLPAFAPRTEVDLLRDYLARDHAYRTKRLVFRDGVIVGGYFWTSYNTESLPLYATASLIASRLYPPATGTALDGDAFADGQPDYLYAVQGGYGGYETLHNSPDANRAQGIRAHAVADLASQGIARCAFYIVKGSFFGHWHLSDNNFMLALLASPGHGLAALWTRSLVYGFESVGLGAPLADVIVRSARGTASVRTTGLLGDPTLRSIVTAPPAKLVVRRQRRQDSSQWQPSPDATAGYHVWRSVAGPDGPFVRLTEAPVQETLWTAPDAPRGKVVYQVRALQLVTTGSGTFVNSSQGVFANPD